MNTEIRLSDDFAYGVFVVDHSTLCATIDPNDPGWIRGQSSIRRYYKAVNGTKRTRVSAVEAVARSLMVYDMAHPEENLVQRMIYQYYGLPNYKRDGGASVELFQKMFDDKTFHVRSRGTCGVRGDCQNPFHRLIEQPRHSELGQYKRFIRYVERRGSLQEALADKRAHQRLNMSALEYKRCVDTYLDETAKLIDL